MNIPEFEQPIVTLDEKIEELSQLLDNPDIDIQEELTRLKKKREQLIKSTYSKLSRWQVVQLSRHECRPHAKDYIEHCFTEFDELHGDRMYGDDAAIIGGTALFQGQPVMIVAQEKGRTTKEKIHHNFGLPKPEGYRKALRLFKLAERFKMPVITFVDTQGAYPGVDAEERGQSEAIARNLFELSTLKTPVICIIIGEGGSGGALAIGVGDVVMMCQYSMYSVITPEGCASILWRSADKASDAAESLRCTAQDALELGLIDQIIEEPLGGAHRDHQAMFANLSNVIEQQLAGVTQKKLTKLLQERYQKLMQFGLS